MKWCSFWNQTNTPDDLWEIMLVIITEAADTLCPIRRMKIRKNVPGWINKEVIEAVNVKKDKMRQFQFSGLEEDWNVFKAQKRHVGTS